MTSKIDAGLELISALGAIELKPIKIRDLLHKLITKDYNTVDKILEAAQKKEKLIQRTEKTNQMTPEASSLQFEKPKIVKQEEMQLVDIVKRNYLQGIMWFSNRIPMGLMDRHAFGKCTLIIYCKEKACHQLQGDLLVPCSVKPFLINPHSEERIFTVSIFPKDEYS